MKKNWVVRQENDRSPECGLELMRRCSSYQEEDLVAKAHSVELLPEARVDEETEEGHGGGLLSLSEPALRRVVKYRYVLSFVAPSRYKY